MSLCKASILQTMAETVVSHLRASVFNELLLFAILMEFVPKIRVILKMMTKIAWKVIDAIFLA